VKLDYLLCSPSGAEPTDNDRSRLLLLVHCCRYDAVNCCVDSRRRYRKFGLEREKCTDDV
jgi:hypothetical protein